jgi:hypothetical protein
MVATPGALRLLVGALFHSITWLSWITYLAVSTTTLWAAIAGLIVMA